MNQRFRDWASLLAFVLTAAIVAFAFEGTACAETLGTNQFFEIPGAEHVYGITDDGRTVLCRSGDTSASGLFLWKMGGSDGPRTIPFPAQLEGGAPASDLFVLHAFLPGKNPDTVIVNLEYNILRWNVEEETAVFLHPDAGALRADCVSETGSVIYAHQHYSALKIAGGGITTLDTENLPGNYRLEHCSSDGLTAFGGWGNLVNNTSCFLYSTGGGAQHRLSANPEVHWLHFDAASGDGLGPVHQFAVGCRDRMVEGGSSVDYTSSILIAQYQGSSLGVTEHPAPSGRIVEFMDASKADLAVGSVKNPATSAFRAFKMDISGSITYLSGDSSVIDTAFAITDDGKEIYGRHYGSDQLASLGPFQWSQSRGYLPLREAIWCDPYHDFGRVSRNGDWAVLYDGNQRWYVADTRNQPPKVDPISPIAVECEDGSNQVTLSTPYSDPDGDSLAIQWLVNGQVVKTVEGASSSGTTTLVHDFPHGDYAVHVAVSDGFLHEVTYTTVTMQDTTVPTVSAAQDVVVPTDPGKAYASGVVLPPPTVTDNCALEWTLVNDAPSVFPAGQTIVNWTATDGSGNVASTTQRVIVQDRERPLIGAVQEVMRFCDPGQPFATVSLVPPSVTDNVPQGVVLTSDAKSRFPVGTTTVTWKAQDAAGNVATKALQVRVVNRAPKANAGKAIVVTTKSERGATVSLNGSASSDPDKHSLKFKWTAPKTVKLAKATTAKPSALFPVGATTVTLKVTDEVGATSTAKVKVTVKLANARPRSLGREANEAFDRTLSHGASGAGRTGDGLSLAASSHASAAGRISIALGDHVRWNEGQSPSDATLSYAEARLLQSRLGEQAAALYLRSYAETGEEDALIAAMWAMSGARFARADAAVD